MKTTTVEKKITCPQIRFRSWMGGMFVFVAIFIFLSIKAPGFFTTINLVRNLLMPAGIVAVIACGMTVVMAGGGIDLSVGATAGLSALVAAVTAARLDLEILPMLVLAIMVGCFIGSINGLFVAYLGVSPFVVTLSSVFLIRGLEFLISLTNVRGTYLMLPMELTDAGSSPYFQLGLFLVVVFSVFIFLDRSCFGRYIRSVGENLEVSHFSGIRYRFYTWLTYAVCGILTAIGGFMLTSYEGVVRVGSGESYLIDSFVLPILGQAVFRRISVEGTVFGALLIYMVLNGLFIFGTPPVFVNLIKGSLLLLVIILSGIQKLRET